MVRARALNPSLANPSPTQLFGRSSPVAGLSRFAATAWWSSRRDTGGLLDYMALTRTGPADPNLGLWMRCSRLRSAALQEGGARARERMSQARVKRRG